MIFRNSRSRETAGSPFRAAVKSRRCVGSDVRDCRLVKNESSAVGAGATLEFFDPRPIEICLRSIHVEGTLQEQADSGNASKIGPEDGRHSSGLRGCH